MQKDLKIGLALGLALVSAAVLWLATRPNLSPEARMLNLHGEGFGQDPDDRSPATAVADNSMPNSDQMPGGNLGASPVRTLTDDEIEQNPPVDLTIHEQAEKIKPEKFHVVRKGQTLSQISYEYYGSAGKWRNIFDANRKIIKNPDILIPGTKLIIPQ